MLKISFLGACDEVARTSILLDNGSTRILLDYGSDITEIPTLHPKRVDVPLDAIFLSHAHLDHSGSLPMLVKHGQTAPIYALGVTKRLTKLLLEDSVKIAQREGYETGFGRKDVRATIRQFAVMRYREPVVVGDAKVVGYDAGHIPGSMGILVEIDGKRIFFTGDYKDEDTQLLSKADFNDVKDVDIMITESTYAQREHPDRKKLEREFANRVKETCNNDGIALVAAFAVGRVQEILLILEKYKVKCPIYVDGMGKKATRIIMDYPKLLRKYDTLRKVASKITFIDTPLKRKRSIKHPGVIVTSAGMLSGGPVVWYLSRLYNDRKSTLFLTGYQVKGTPGRTLLETGRFANDEINVKVKMNISYYDFSAHVGRSGLFKTIEKIQPKKVFCIHGDDTFSFAEELRDLGYDAIAPGFAGETFTFP